MSLDNGNATCSMSRCVESVFSRGFSNEGLYLDGAETCAYPETEICCRLAVLVDHAFGHLAASNSLPARYVQIGWQIGMMGVWVFFAISGFIMVNTEYRNFGERQNGAKFINKRLMRIIPLY